MTVNIELTTIGRRRRHLPQVLSLLVYARRFESSRPQQTYDRILERLNIARRRNVPQFISRILCDLVELLGDGCIEITSEGPRTAVAISTSADFTLTIDGHAATRRSLEVFGGFRRTSESSKPFPHAELPWCKAVIKVAESEIAFRSGELPESIAAATNSIVTLGREISPKMRSLLYLHTLRSQRRLEHWEGLRNSILLARKSIRSRGWTQQDKDVLLGIVHLYEAWDLYDHAGIGGPQAYENILGRLEESSLDNASHLNASVGAERSNLLALVVRRMSIALRESRGVESTELRLRYETQAMTHSALAIELAGLTGDLTALANYLGNRSLLLATKIRSQQVAGGGLAPTREDWYCAMRWLAASHHIVLSANLGRDNLLNATFLLILSRYSHAAVPWRHMVDQAARVSPWFHDFHDRSVVDTALAMIKPTLDRVLDRKSFNGRPDMHRQLFDLADELTREDRPEVGYIEETVLLRRIVCAVMEARQTKATDEPRHKTVRDRLRDWLGSH